MLAICTVLASFPGSPTVSDEKLGGACYVCVTNHILRERVKETDHPNKDSLPMYVGNLAVPTISFDHFQYNSTPQCGGSTTYNICISL